MTLIWHRTSRNRPKRGEEVIGLWKPQEDDDVYRSDIVFWRIGGRRARRHSYWRNKKEIVGIPDFWTEIPTFKRKRKKTKKKEEPKKIDRYDLLDIE